MPGFSCKSYQEIIGEGSFLVNRNFKRGDIAAILPNMMMSRPDLGNRLGLRDSGGCRINVYDR